MILSGKMDKDDKKYLYGIYKNFKKKYPYLTFNEFQKEMERDDFNKELFHERLQRKQFGDFGKWL